MAEAAASETVEAQDLAKVEEILHQAEDVVLHNALERQVVVSGKERTLRPLCNRDSRRYGSFMNGVMREYNKLGRLTEEEQINQDMNILDQQNEIVCNGMVDALLFLGSIYKWSDVTKDSIETLMTTSQIKGAVQEQVQLNGDDDFLLQSWRIILHVISLAKAAADRMVAPETPSPVISPASANSGV